MPNQQVLSALKVMQVHQCNIIHAIVCAWTEGLTSEQSKLLIMTSYASTAICYSA